MKNKTLWLFPICYLLTSSGLCQTREPGNFVINGYVVDAYGAPVPDASVDVFDLRGSFNHPVPTVQTMKDGRFQAVVDSIGHYRLMVWKQSANVPDPVISIYESPEVNYPVVEVLAGVPTPSVRLSLPRPFGQLAVKVVDGNSGSEISTARITVTYADDQRLYLSKGVGKEGRVNMLLPRKQLTL